MRITLLISQLGAGGAERVMSLMANYWVEHGQEVTLITLSAETADWHGIQLDPKVTRVGLNLVSSSSHIASAVRNNVERVKRLRQALRRSQADVAIAFGDATNMLTLIAGRGLGIPVVISERIDPRHHPIGSIWNGLRTLLYPYADALVVQTEGVRDWARSLMTESRVHIIPNPVRPALHRREYPAAARSLSHTLVAIGRLDRQKGFDLLVQALAQCVQKHPEWSLVILGEGDERAALESLICELDLKDKVSLPGRVKDPVPFLQRADLFVLPSRYEGFPNALLEAMACGLAVISTDCSSGPRAIIRDGLDGVLVPPDNIDALASAMDRLMADHGERKRLGGRAVEVVERFNVKAVMEAWNKLLTDVSRVSHT